MTTPDDQVAEATAAELETLSLECRADPDRLGSFLSPDFHEFGSSGGELTFDGTATRVASMTQQNPAPIHAENLRGSWLSEGLVMVKYTSECDGRRSNRTSLWRRHTT